MHSLLNMIVAIINVVAILDRAVGNDGRKGAMKFGGEKL